MHEADVDAQARAAQWLEAGRLMGVPFAVRPGGAPQTEPVATPDARGSAPAAPATRPGESAAPAAAPAPARGTLPLDASAAVPSPASPASPGPHADPAAALTALADRYANEVAANFSDHPFTNVVFGEGNPRASLMVIGEAPGADEDRQGRPFVGRAGDKLDDMIRAMKQERSEAYIANVLKIRPPDNRTPLVHEIDRCGPFLREQIRIIQPRVILALGGPATKWLLQTDVGITRLRGAWGEYVDPDHPSVRIPVLPTFHPAYLLRTYTLEVREKMWHDLQQVMGRLAEVQAGPGAGAEAAKS